MKKKQLRGVRREPDQGQRIRVHFRALPYKKKASQKHYLKIQTGFKKLNFIKIMSLPSANGSVQDLHLDFCPKAYKGEQFCEVYREYFEQVENLRCPQLSALHFPMGGAFSYMQGDIFSLNACVLKLLEYGEN